MHALEARFLRSGFRVGVSGALAFWTTSACLSVSKYHTDNQDDRAAAGAGPGAKIVTHEVDPKALDRLLDAFESRDQACRGAIQESCQSALALCASSSACVEFAECTRGLASPAAGTTCSDKFGTGLEDSWAYEFLRHCWAERYADCAVGRNFDCVGDYGPPSGDRKDVIVSQQVLVAVPEPELSVSFCPGLVDCLQPTVIATPSAIDSIYTVNLEVFGKNFGIGNDWTGYRLITGTGLYPSIVGSNLPFWGRTLEITRLLSADFIDVLSEIHREDARNALFVQVVDCQSDPAPGIFVDLPASPDATVVYVDASFQRVDGPTVSTGAVGIYGHVPDEIQDLRATRKGSEGAEMVARYSGYIQGGKPHYLRLYPTMTEH